MAKKLDANGVAELWDIIKSYVNDNKITVYGSIAPYQTTQGFSKNGLVTVNDETYVSNADVTGLPSHVVTYNNEVTTQGDSVVTNGTNSEAKWVKTPADS